jgi:hypothetical protein
MNKCKSCGKLTNNPKFCSLNCAGRVHGKINVRKSIITNRKNKTGLFDYRVRNIGTKKSNFINKKNKTGIYGETREQKVLGGRRAAIITKKTKTGVYGLTREQRAAGGRIGGVKSSAMNKKNKIGIYGLTKSQRVAGGRIGGVKTVKKLIKHSKYKWYGVGFLSKAERECAKILLTRPIVNYNCHIRVGSKTIDFFPQKEDKIFMGQFVEFHPVVKFLHSESKTRYYNRRRKALDDNGFKNKKLIVIQNLNEISKYVKEKK